MISIRKILVPVALSPACAWAARYGLGLANKFGAELVFLHLAQKIPAPELEKFLKREIPGAPYKSVVREGEPAESIIAFAEEYFCDLILMPTHAYGRFRRFLLGSVTAKVLHDADCPVWTGVHRQDGLFSDRAVVNSIVCGVDLNPDCVPVVQWAQDLAECFHATLKIVHAEPAVDESSDNVGEVQLRRYLFDRAEIELARVFGRAGLKTMVTLRGGSIAQVIREAALLEHSDLIVIGRGHTQRQFGHLRTGAYSIIRESPCPVLSI
jgi:nucleotide-binding universal stress UspA family protein